MSGSGASTSSTAEFERFVYADVAIQPNGMELSVLSALSRRGVDPWQEAQQLAQLPQVAAADRLAQMLGALPAVQSLHVNVRTLAERLVALLPARRGVSGGSSFASTPNTAAPTATAATQIPRGFTLAMTAAILAGMLVPMLMPKPADPIAPSSWIADAPKVADAPPKIADAPPKLADAPEVPVADHAGKQVTTPLPAPH